MISTGNDIVALNAINAERTKQFRFYSKILSPAEQDLGVSLQFSAIPFERYVWLLWSIKEAAFKYLKRNDPDLMFSPSKTEVRNIVLPRKTTLKPFDQEWLDQSSFKSDELCESTVTYGPQILYARSLISHELIHSVVSADAQFENVCWGIKSIDSAEYEHQSLDVRSFALAALTKVFQDRPLQIKKSAVGYPVVLSGRKITNIPLSFTHHNHFVGYSFIPICR